MVGISASRTRLKEFARLRSQSERTNFSRSGVNSWMVIRGPSGKVVGFLAAVADDISIVVALAWSKCLPIKRRLYSVVDFLFLLFGFFLLLHAPMVIFPMTLSYVSFHQASNSFFFSFFENPIPLSVFTGVSFGRFLFVGGGGNREVSGIITVDTPCSAAPRPFPL